MDLSGVIEQAKRSVAGKPLLDSLRVLALGGKAPSLDDLRKEVGDVSRRTPLQSLITKNFLDARGRKVGSRGPLAPSVAGFDVAMEVEMAHHAAIHRRLQAAGVIDPIRQVIVKEHGPTEADLAPVLDLNPFVPADRKVLFARGLVAGLRGDTLLATHLLIPQLENSLRTLLVDAGHIASSFDSGGVEELFGLETLLKHPTLVTMFGEDQLFDLRALLVERTSTNLRHSVAHGLMGDFDFSSEDCLYFWWLMLRFCLIPFIYRQQAQAGQPPNPDEASGDRKPGEDGVGGSSQEEES